MDVKNPNWKTVIAILFVTTLLNPLIGLAATIWLLSGYVAYKLFPIIAPIVLYGAATLSIGLFIVMTIRSIL